MSKVFISLALAIGALSFNSNCGYERRDDSRAASPVPQTSAANTHNTVQKNINAQALNNAVKKPRSIVDYYLLLPDEYFTDSPHDAQSRLGYIKIKDVQNGYIEAQTPFQIDEAVGADKDLIEAENNVAKFRSQIKLALFKKTNGDDLIAITYPSDTDSSLAMKQAISFLEYKAGEWHEVTDAVLKHVDADLAFEAYEKQGKPGNEGNRRDSAQDLKGDFFYLLPRHGKTIKVILDPQWSTAGQVELLNLTWQDDKFKAEPAV